MSSSRPKGAESIFLRARRPSLSKRSASLADKDVRPVSVPCAAAPPFSASGEASGAEAAPWMPLFSWAFVLLLAFGQCARLNPGPCDPAVRSSWVCDPSRRVSADSTDPGSHRRISRPIDSVGRFGSIESVQSSLLHKPALPNRPGRRRRGQSIGSGPESGPSDASNIACSCAKSCASKSAWAPVLSRMLWAVS